MKLNTVSDALSCTVHFGPEGWESKEAAGVAAGDLMSDVLVQEGVNTLLVTALNSDQVIRTADIVEAAAVLMVSGKTPQKSVIQLAVESGMPLLSTSLSMYRACGILSSLEGEE